MYIDLMTAPKAIEASGLKTKELADLMGVDNVTAWRWRNGEIKPKPELLEKMARVLRCRPHDLRPDLAKIFEAK